jgi:hypothetical protein
MVLVMQPIHDKDAAEEEGSGENEIKHLIEKEKVES